MSLQTQEVGYTVKALDANGGWRLEVNGLPFDSVDADNEYFSVKTVIHEDKYSLPPIVYYHGFDPDGKPSGKPAYIGKAIKREKRADGWWYIVDLDKSHPYAKRVWEAALVGKAGASSGSAPHLTRVSRNGHIDEWVVVELSLLDIEGGRAPKNRYAVARPLLKAYGFADSVLEASDEASDEARNVERQTIPDKGKHMEPKEVQALIDAGVASALKAQQDAAAAKQAQDAAIEERVKAETERRVKELEATKANRLSDSATPESIKSGSAPNIAQFSNLWRYDNTPTEDLAWAANVFQAGMTAGHMTRRPSVDVVKALAVRVVDNEKETQYNVTRGAMKAQGLPLKANELNHSTQAGFGDEWIGVEYSRVAWDKIRVEAAIASLLPTVVVPEGSESIVVPVIGASTTFYKIAQGTAQDANPGRTTATFTTSKLATTNKTLTVSKFGSAANFSSELEEDSVLMWASTLRADMEAEAREILDHLVIDGDTETGATTNINDIAGTPAATDVFLTMNGFRKLCLVTNTANSRSGGALGIDDFLETVKLMGLAGRNAVDKRKVAFILDPWTAWKALELVQLLTADVRPSAPTLEDGALTSIWGYKVYTSYNMHRANQDSTYGLKANTAGKTDLDTASNNTTGAVLAVRFDQWVLGYKRRWKFETKRDPESDSTGIYMSSRVGMVNRDTDASAISYNITV